MASSLAPECTPLKQEYDGCFNKWLQGYLQLINNDPSGSQADPKKLQQKGKELDQTCGKAFKAYNQCLQKDLEEKGVLELIQASREAEPLRSPQETEFPNYKS